MGKILGEVFDKYVDEQIKIRQNSLGKSQKSTDDLVVFNSSTPWIRLSSSVEVGKDRAKTLATNLGINQSEVVGRNLAKNLVLFAGTSDGADLSNKKGGVGYGLKNSYGFLSGQKQGYRPMPGVTGISASYKNNGTLKQAQVSLKCFTREQFEAVEAIYLRLGYTMILEWGHSVYFDNNNKRRNMSSLEIPNILFIDKIPPTKVVGPEELGSVTLDLTTSSFRGPEGVKEFDREIPEGAQKAYAKSLGITVDELKNLYRNNIAYPEKLRIAIEGNKKKTSGNYDAMVAKVSNFSWSLNDDLSYDITLDLVSVGDVIDSLKMNFGGINITSTNAPQIETDAGVQNLVAIELASGASAFNTFLYELTQTDDKVIQKQTDEATQEQIKLKNEAVKVAQIYVPLITEKYPPVIEELKKEFIAPYEEVRNLLNGAEVSAITSQYGTYYQIKSSEVRNKLKEILSGSLKKLGSLESKYQFIDQNGNLSIGRGSLGTEFAFRNTFNLVVDEESKTLRKDTENKIADTELTQTIKDLETQLTKIEQQVNNIVVRSGSEDPNQNNTAILTYLGQNAKRAKEVVLDALFEGFYDGKNNGEDGKFKSDAETIDFAVQTTIVRKWVRGEK